MAIIAYGIYWINTMDERISREVKRESDLAELKKRNQKYIDDKLDTLVSRFGKKHSLYNSVIISRSSYLSLHNHNSILKYNWKNILIEDTSEYPKITGKIIETSKKIDHNNEIGRVVTFDLFKEDNSYISEKEFEKDIRKENDIRRIFQIENETRQLNNSRRIYTKERTLWQRYYEQLPNGFYNDMTGLDFEKYIENLFTKKGYKVLRTSPTRDQGVDIIAEDSRRSKIAIQTKRYTAKVGNKAVQEVVAGKIYHACSEAWVITNSVFTESAIQLAKVNKVRLIDGAELIQFFRELKTQTDIIPVFDKNIFNHIRPIAEKLPYSNAIDGESIDSPYDLKIQKLNVELVRLKKSLESTE